MNGFDKKSKMNELAQANGYANSQDMMTEMFDTWGADSNIVKDENGMYTYDGANITEEQKNILDGLNEINREEMDKRAKREEMASSIGNNKPKREVTPEREKMAEDLSNSINR